MAHVPYASFVGSLMYAMVYTWLDTAHAVGVLRRYMSTPRKEHWNVVKECLGTCVEWYIFQFATKVNRKPTVKSRYMALENPTGLVILTVESQLVDMFSSYLVVQTIRWLRGSR